MKRIPTGITGLDKLVEGGFPEGRSILLSGACGTGKTIFSMQYIYNGAKKYSEPGIYVTLDERPELIREDVIRFGWDLRKLEQENMLQIIDGSIAKLGIPSEEEVSMPATGFDLDKLLLEIMRVTKRIGAKRLVIDSIPALGLSLENNSEVRKSVLKLSYLLMRTGVTSIITSEIQEGANKFGKFGVEEYVVDGVIALYLVQKGMQFDRSLMVHKMHSTNHSLRMHPAKIDAAANFKNSRRVVIIL